MGVEDKDYVASTKYCEFKYAEPKFNCYGINNGTHVIDWSCTYIGNFIAYHTRDFAGLYEPRLDNMSRPAATPPKFAQNGNGELIFF